MQAFHFLVSTLFDLYLMVTILRVWLQLARADFYNPVSQFVVKATNPLLVPLRRIIPGLGGIDCAGLVLVYLVGTLKVVAIQAMFGNGFPMPDIFIAGLFTVIQEIFTIVFWVTIVRAILSWISQGYNPVEALLHQLTDPLLAPIRKVIPPIGGLDLSLIVFLIGLQFLQILVGEMLKMVF